VTISEPHAPTADCEACRLLFTEDDGPDPITRTRHADEYSVIERALPGGRLSAWIRRRTVGPTYPAQPVRRYHYAGRL
jgi:hypothetical protein